MNRPVPVQITTADVEARLREDGERKRRLAVQAERNREERFLDYCLKHSECYPTPHEWATWKKMRTLNRFRWYAR